MTLPHLKVISFDHLVLKCADVERSLAFYVGTLGLQPVRVDDWRRGQVPFPSVRISPHTLIDLFSGAAPGTHIDHFCLVIQPADLDALGLLFAGARRADQVYGARGLGRSLYVSDPDGNTVELRVYDH
jgi:catechol 2,3-dioxygenase-like lactoylglutathione lyase family enzyme